MSRNDFIITENFSPGDLPQKRTYIIFGMPRGGTTMVTGVASLLGLHLGSDLPVNLEDNNFNLDVLDGSPEDKIHHIRAQIEKNSETRDVWGWKFPMAAHYLPKVLDNVVNPHLIVVFRDFPAQSYRHYRSHPTKADQLLKVYVNRLNKVIQIFRMTECPRILFSYEKCTMRRNVFIDEMATFLGTEVPDDDKRATIKEFMEPGKYKPLELFE